MLEMEIFPRLHDSSPNTQVSLEKCTTVFIEIYIDVRQNK